MSAVVRLENVSKKFLLHHHKARSFQDALVNLVHQRNGTVEEFWALRDVNFDVKKGEALGIIGENGSGKSTILKLVTNILRPTTGRVSVNGRVSALIEVGAGFHHDLTGRENIYLNGAILGLSRQDMNRKFDEIVAFSELERFIDTPVKHYSSGMYMRLGFSVAISVEPDILVIDEVLAVGDEVFQRKCFDRIAEFRRRGKTIIFVSHVLPMVEQICDRAVWLHHGVLQQEGTAARVVMSYLEALRRHDEENRVVEHQAAATHVNDRSESNDYPVADGIQVLDVRLLSKDGNERYSFRTGDTIILRVRYRVDDPDVDCRWGFALRRNDGLLLYSSCVPHVLPFRTLRNGEGIFDIEIANLPLLSGSYEIIPLVGSSDQPARPWSDDSMRRSFSVWSDVEQAGLVAVQWRSLECQDGTPVIAGAGVVEQGVAE